MKTRGSTEIIGLILQAVEREALTRSKIMYKVFLNFKQVNDYTAFLTEEGLLTYLAQERKYLITDRGRQFLILFEETKKLLNNYGDKTAASNEEQNLQEHEMTFHKYRY
jgi:predicted transcriptional regulator